MQLSSTNAIDPGAKDGVCTIDLIVNIALSSPWQKSTQVLKNGVTPEASKWQRRNLNQAHYNQNLCSQWTGSLSLILHRGHIQVSSLEKRL